MPYARIPPDKLANLALFGIEFIDTDGDLLWYHGPGDMLQSVNRLNPRVWFEDAGEAHQAGARGILISGDADREALEKAIEAERVAAEQQHRGDEDPPQEGDLPRDDPS